MNHSKAVVRLTLLRILKAICDVHPNRVGLVEKYGIYEIVEKLSKQDGAVLVRELAREIMPFIAPVLKPAQSRQSKNGELAPKMSLAPKRRPRRTASDASFSATDITPKTAPSTSRFQASTRSRAVPRQKLGDISWVPDNR